MRQSFFFFLLKKGVSKNEFSRILWIGIGRIDIYVTETRLLHFLRWASLMTQSVEESACSAEDLSFESWVRKIPRRRKWQPTPVFLPGESRQWTEEPGRLQHMGSQELDTS